MNCLPNQLNALLKNRQREPEIMDQANLDPDQHRHALSGLARINNWSGSARILWGPLKRLARECRKPLRVLDIATGAGDLPLRLWQKARNKRLPLSIEACDISETALAFARAKARACNADVRFFALDALTSPLPQGFDVICCSLFLHHLDEADVISLLVRMKQASPRMILINDLRRSRIGWLVAWLGCRILTRSQIVHVDGPLSVRAAFTISEAKRLAESAGLHGGRVASRWPWRWLLTWRNPDRIHGD